MKFHECHANREEWVQELELVDRKQTTGQLATDDYSAFCCLGVAEDTVGKKFGIERYRDGDFILEDYGEDSILHFDLRVGMGLSKTQENILVILNDNINASFTHIALVAREMEFYCDDGIYDRYGNRIGEMEQSRYEREFVSDLLRVPYENL